MIGYYLFQKCEQKLKENASLILQKLSDPGSMISFNASGALVEAAAGGLQGLAAFAGKYLEKNADALLMSALEATGLEKGFMEAYNLAMNLLALALMANNNLVLKMMQELAFTCMKELAKKDEKLIEMADKTKEMYMLLKSLVDTKDIWSEYYSNLRRSLALAAEVRADIKMVHSTFSKADFWLAKKFDGTVKKLENCKGSYHPQEEQPSCREDFLGIL